MAWDRRTAVRQPGRIITTRPTYQDFAPRPSDRYRRVRPLESPWDEIESLDSGISGFQFHFDNKLPPETPHSRRSLSLQDPVQEKIDPLSASVAQVCSDISLGEYESTKNNIGIRAKTHGNLWRYLLLVTIPILIPPILVLALVLIYQQHHEVGAFPGATPSFQQMKIYVFVHFRDTWLVFIVSIINFWTPVLASIIMAKFAPHVARRLRMATATATTTHMPSPYEMKLIAGLCQSSPAQFFKAYRHCFWKRGRKIPPALKIAASMSLILNLLWILSFVSVALIHYCTQTVTYQKIVAPPSTLPFPGRMLSQSCLTFNRTKNRYPCSFNSSDPDLPNQEQEAWKLTHGNSATSLIQFIQPQANQTLELAILAPSAQAIGQDIDFRARSIAVSTECSFITTSCDMRYANATGADSFYTDFNCSNSFYGTLGKFPVSSSQTTTAGDPDVCPLCYQPTALTTLGYYTDAALEIPYNSVGYDPSTLSAVGSPFSPTPDSKLVNPAYLGVASRIVMYGLGGNFTGHPEIFAGVHTYAEFAMQCKLSTYDIEYTSLGGEIQDINYTLSPNGTALEIFHGTQFYQLTTSSMDDIQLIMDTTQLETSIPAGRQEFERLFSSKMLGVIGSVTSLRQATTIQARENILVSQIPWPAIVAVVLFPAIYTVLGICVLFSARVRDTTGGIEDKDHLLGDQISTAGEIWGAFFPTKIATQLKGSNPRRSQCLWSTDEVRVRVDSPDGSRPHLKLVSVPRSEVF